MFNSHGKVHNPIKYLTNEGDIRAFSAMPNEVRYASSDFARRSTLLQRAGPDKVEKGPGKREDICFISGIFIPPLEVFCGGHKTTKNVYRESSPLHGRQEIPKMFSLFCSILPKKRLYFLFQCL